MSDEYPVQTTSNLESWTEKERRIYYQDLVYHTCNVLDHLYPGKPIVCGTCASPSEELQESLSRLANEVESLRIGERAK